MGSRSRPELVLLGPPTARADDHFVGEFKLVLSDLRESPMHLASLFIVKNDMFGSLLMLGGFPGHGYKRRVFSMGMTNTSAEREKFGPNRYQIPVGSLEWKKLKRK